MALMAALVALWLWLLLLLSSAMAMAMAMEVALTVAPVVESCEGRWWRCRRKGDLSLFTGDMSTKSSSTRVGKAYLAAAVMVMVVLLLLLIGHTAVHPGRETTLPGAELFSALAARGLFHGLIVWVNV